MELSAQLPADLAALMAPAGRAPPELLPLPTGAPCAATPATPFDLVLLELAGTAIPSGDALPADGNELPSVQVDSPTEDSGAPLDPLCVSELLALVAPPPAQPLPVSAAPAVPAADAGSPAPSVAGAAAPLPKEAPSFQAPSGALARAAAPATVLPQTADAPTVATGGPAEPVSADAAPVEQPKPGSAAPSPQAASTASNSDRVVAAIAAAQSAPAAEADASSVPAPARAIPEPRPNPERRSANAAPTASLTTAADTPRANSAPLPQPFVLPPVAGAGDRSAAAAQPAHAADPPPLAATPTAPADAQPLPPAHSPAFTVAHGAAAVDGSPAQSAAAPLAHQGGSVDTTAARWHDALASRVQWLVDHDVGEARIKLNPPELGALDVKISLHDDKTFVQLTAHSSAARDELSQSLPRLRELLSANGLELGGATVSGGHDGRAGRHGAEPAPRAFGFAATSRAEPVTRAARTASSRIDVFA